MQARQQTTGQRSARPRRAAGPQVNGAPVRPPPLLTPGALAAWAAEMDVDPAAVGLDDEGYPYCDGEPMAQNSVQYDELLRLGSMIEARYHGRSDVFAGGDLLMHHDERRRLASAAPDILVAFGAEPLPYRMSYKLWRPGDPAPDFVMEVLSPTTKRNDMGGSDWVEGAPFTAGTPGKPGRYARMGVGEFWLYDPFGTDIPPKVAGYRLDGGVYRPLPRRPDGAWRSEALGLDLHPVGDRLKLRDVATGQDLKDLVEALGYGKRKREAYRQEREAHRQEREAHRQEREAHDETKAHLAAAEARQAASDAEIARLRAELERRAAPDAPVSRTG